MKNLVFMVVLSLVMGLVSAVALAKTIDVSIKGVDDGIKTNKQGDYKEALMNAKQQVIEKVGENIKSITIKSITQIKDGKLKYDMIESMAKAVLLPGFQVMDMGYQGDGTYQLVLSGKVRVGKKPVKIIPQRMLLRYAKFLVKEKNIVQARKVIEEVLKTGKDDNGLAEALYYKAIWGFRDWHEIYLTLITYYPNSKYVALLSSHIKNGRWRNALGMEFVYIRPGTFMMGRPSNETGRDDEERQYRVTLTKGFYMQTTEVTQGQWKQVMGNKNKRSYFKNCGDNCPVEQVSLNDVQRYIKKLNGMEGANKYRLPTEAEWEYAARAGSITGFCFGDDDSQRDQYGWYSSNSGGTTHPVAQKKPNAWGLYDMYGNVWEWCQDLGVGDPSVSASYRVIRGGSWYDVSGNCLSANRGRVVSGGVRVDYLGFRLARDN